MPAFLKNIFLCAASDQKDPQVRRRMCMLSGAVGMAANLVLFIIKFSVGLFMGSVAVRSDAFNNLTDLGTSAVTLIGAKMSGRAPDKEHPFGHGRIEYITALIISFLILFMGFELARESFYKLFERESVRFSAVTLSLLAISVLIKLGMYLYNRALAKRSDSDVIRAAQTDCLSDACATTAVIISAVLEHFINFPFDAVAGIAVSVLIAYNGYRLASDTISTLLGRPPEPKLVSEIEKLILEGENIVGLHDLIVHDYGPGRIFASVHAEVPDTVDIVRMHEIVDAIEAKILEITGVVTVIHTDPISTSCDLTNLMRASAAAIVHSVEPSCSLHDFRITDGESNINVLFDLAIPADIPARRKGEIKAEVTRQIEALDERYQVKIHIDDLFV